MTLTDWEEGRKAYLLSVLSPAQGQLNAANCMLTNCSVGRFFRCCTGHLENVFHNKAMKLLP